MFIISGGNVIVMKISNIDEVVCEWGGYGKQSLVFIKQIQLTSSLCTPVTNTCRLILHYTSFFDIWLVISVGLQLTQIIRLKVLP